MMTDAVTVCTPNGADTPFTYTYADKKCRGQNIKCSFSMHCASMHTKYSGIKIWMAVSFYCCRFLLDCEQIITKITETNITKPIKSHQHNASNTKIKSAYKISIYCCKNEEKNNNTQCNSTINCSHLNNK